jgi:phage terminase Nu1 subunit (DNA packaging protein)
MIKTEAASLADPTVSQADFARLHGVSRKTVTQWKAEGRLAIVAGEVDVEATDARLSDAGLGKFREKYDVESPMTEARRRHAMAAAELAELKLAQRRGELVTIESVTEVLRAELTAVRGRLLAMPGRLAMSLVGKTDPAEIEAAIHEEVIGALSELSTQ